jgi:hypothetical protein
MTIELKPPKDNDQRAGGHEVRWTLHDTQNSRTINSLEAVKNCPPAPLHRLVGRSRARGRYDLAKATLLRLEDS